MRAACLLAAALAAACAAPRREPLAPGEVAGLTVVSEDAVEAGVAMPADRALEAAAGALRSFQAREVTVHPARRAIEAGWDDARVVATVIPADPGRATLRVAASRYGFPHLDVAREVLARLRREME